MTRLNTKTNSFNIILKLQRHQVYKALFFSLWFAMYVGKVSQEKKANKLQIRAGSITNSISRQASLNLDLHPLMHQNFCYDVKD